MAALPNLVRIVKGGSAADNIAELLAAQVLEITSSLVSSCASQLVQLPPDLLSELLELWSVSLAPRYTLLAPRLLQAPGSPLAGFMMLVSPVLPVSQNPRCVCRGVLLWGRLSEWTEKPGAHSETAANLLQGILPAAASATCQLLASSPLASDEQVADALSKSLLSLARSRQQAFSSMLAQEAEAVGVARAEGELLAMQIADPLQSEDALSEALREVATGWQADHLKRSLLPTG